MTRISPAARAELGALYQDVQEDLWHYAFRLMAKDRGHAEDLSQEVFQAAARQWPQLRSQGRDRQRAWLHAVMKNKAMDHWRQRQRKAPLPLPDTGPATVAACDTPRTAISNVLLHKCWEAIDEMPPARRTVALLRWHADWTPSEISRGLEMSLKTVHAHLTTARRELARDFGDEVVFPSDWLQTVPGEESVR